MTPSPAPPDAWTMTELGPQVLMPFDYGTAVVTFTDKSHCLVSSSSLAQRGAGDIEFRGRRWRARVSLLAAHNWGEDPAVMATDHQFTSRGQDKPLAQVYRARIVAAMSAAVRGYIADHPDGLSAAEISYLSHELASAEKAVREAYGAWTAALTRMQGIRAGLATAYRGSGTAPPPELFQ